MGGKTVPVYLTTNNAAKIKKWKVREGMLVSARQVIFLYDSVTSDSNEQLKFKCMQVGTVRKLVAKEGDVVDPGGVLLELEECTHPTVMKDMCAECGADLRKDEQVTVNASVPMVHSIPELKVSEEQAQILGKADEARLITDKKLVLLVDLDQTLIHTTNDNIPANLKDVYHFQLCGPKSPWYHTRIRPGTHNFLEEISKYYELHICTFGARDYAHTIAMYLDPVGKFFSHRILSRDECFNANSKTANLKALFPCGDNMVCIIDDREDVWNYAPNLIHVKPYHFFQHTGDINAPPGLTKKENDEIGGYDFSKLEKTSKETKLPEENSDKKTVQPDANKTKIEILGESTTDKDTDDEAENKCTKVMSKEESIERVTGDLQLSEDDSEDTRTEAKEPTEPTDEKTVDTEVETSVATKDESMETCESNEKTNVAKDVVEEVSNVSNDGAKESLNENISCNSSVGTEDNLDTAVSNKLSDDVKENPDVVVSNKSGDGTKENSDTEVSDLPKIDDSDETNKTNISKQSSENVNDSESVSNSQEPEHKNDTENLIEVEDPDDYLMYLEDILKSIHKAYYELYDTKKDAGSGIPDLKTVIPDVKKKVLKGCHLVFSGLVPSHVPLHQSRAYLVAISLGATVSADVSASCTHLVAARLGTAKVNSSRRHKGITIVTPSWLWHCAERWERVDERLYHLGRGGAPNRIPPAHCGSPEHNSNNAETEHYSPALRSRTPSGRFIDTINPLLTFSSEDRKIMDQEVEDLFKEEEDDDDDDDDDDEETESELEKKGLLKMKTPAQPGAEESSTSSSEESLSGGTHPKGWSEDKKKSRKRKAETTTCTESEVDEETPSVKFRRGEPLPSDLDLGEDSQDTPGSDEPIDDVDDGDWNMMGAALEREFLSGE